MLGGGWMGGCWVVDGWVGVGGCWVVDGWVNGCWWVLGGGWVVDCQWESVGAGRLVGELSKFLGFWLVSLGGKVG